MNDYEATVKVVKLRLENNDRQLSEMLGMSRTTMYKRLKEKKWKLAERHLIKDL